MASNISFLQNEILIDGVSTTKVTETLKAAGLPSAKVAEIVGFWYVGATGAGRPAPFDFTTDVQATDPSCAVTYARGFVHTDWFDGESRVQAGTTAEELGFNARFHAIENEFDAIAHQFTTLGSCVAEIRSDLFGIVQELESKITALQNDIADLRAEIRRARPPLDIVGKAVVGNKDVFITKTADDFSLIQFEGATVGRTTTTTTAPVLPSERTFDPAATSPDDFVKITSDVEGLLNQPALRDLITRPGGASVADLRAATGSVVLPSGISFASLIAAMPADTRFTDVAGAVGAVTSFVATTLPATTASELKERVIGDPTARDRTGSALLNTGISALGVDAAVEGALREAGVTTIGTLSKTTTADLQGTLAAAGTVVPADALTEAVAKAQVARALRGAGA